MTQIKTLIVHPALTPYRIDLFNRLAHVVDLTVVFLNDSVFYYPAFNQERLKTSLRCRHQTLPSGIPLGRQRIPIGLTHIIDDVKPEVIVSHEFSFVTLAIMFHRIVFPHRYAHVVWTTENISLFRSRGCIRRLIQKLCSTAAHSLLMYSEGIADTFIHHYNLPKEKVFICANLQDEDIFRSKLSQALGAVTQHVTTYHLEGKKVVLYVGRLDRKKNLAVLLKTFDRLHTHDTSTVLVFVGDGPERKRLEKIASRLDSAQNILFAGHCEGYHLTVWYLISAVLVLPSTWEPYGAVVNEALVSGMPVVCSSRAGASVLIQNGKNGYVVNPYDTNELYTTVAAVLAHSPGLETKNRVLRDSLMPVLFERDLNSFVNAVSYAAKEAGM